MIGTRAGTTGLVESPLLSNGHGGFGKRPGGTGQSKDRHRAPGRLRGGKDNYAVDQEAAREILQAVPEVRDMARENRAFLQRAVRFLVGGAGIRQIIDIGTGIPAAGNVHEVAREVAPDVGVVYVDNDPIVHVHASALLTGTGSTGIVLADLREPETILAHPKVRELIDFGQPVALLLVAILHFITDDENPERIVATFRDALPLGSYLALTHGTADFHSQDAVSHGTKVYQRATAPLGLASHAQVTALFDGFDLVEPGLVQAAVASGWQAPSPARPRRDRHLRWRRPAPQC